MTWYLRIRGFLRSCDFFEAPAQVIINSAPASWPPGTKSTEKPQVSKGKTDLIYETFMYKYPWMCYLMTSNRYSHLLYIRRYKFSTQILLVFGFWLFRGWSPFWHGSPKQQTREPTGCIHLLRVFSPAFSLASLPSNHQPLCMRELPSCLGIFWISSIIVPAIWFNVH